MSTINKLLPEKLSSYDWYIDQLTLMLKNDSGVTGQIKYYIDILKKLEEEGLKILNNIDIFNINRYQYDDLLDKLASIFGCSRKYYLSDEILELSNDELILNILITIIRNNFDGTTKTLRESYEKVSKAIEGSMGISINVSCFIDNENEATAYIIFNYLVKNSDSDVAKHLVKLIEGGIFNINSVGINYKISAIDASAGSQYASSDSSASGDAIWGSAYWQFN